MIKFWQLSSELPRRLDGNRLMPKLRLPSTIPGVKQTSATVTRWLKKPGESFNKSDLLVELELVDSLIHLEAPDAGVLSIISVAAGKTVPLGSELADFTTGTSATASAATHSPSQGQPKMSTPAPSGKVTPVLMPQAGNSMEEGKILSWKVKVGDRITAGQVICEIETDKASIEFEATDAGRIARIVAPEGATIPVKEPIAYLAENDADLSGILTPDAGNVAETKAPAQPATAPLAAKPAVAPGGKVTPILMPQASNSMEEGTVTKWLVKVGDEIKVGQVIFEIDTDKASVEVEATDAGKLARIVADVGAVIAVKQPVAFIADNPADVDAYLSSSDTTAAVATPAQTTIAAPVAAVVTTSASSATSSNGGRVKASPAAKKIAQSRGLDLASVGAGSGPGGRILSTDLNRAVAAKSAPVAATGGITRKPLSKMRKAIATNLQVSKQTVPHFYVKQTINADPLFAFYKAQKPATGCTLNDVILLAVGRSVNAFPAFRSRIEGNELLELPNSNIGVAVSVDDGLVVPVILALEGHTLASLASESKRVIEGARKGKLENSGKGVFTISNMGMLGVEEFSAIINPPESGILAISAVREAMIVKDGAMKVGRVMTLTLSVDHRVVDGALAAQFMGKLKELLENPDSLMS